MSNRANYRSPRYRNSPRLDTEVLCVRRLTAGLLVANNGAQEELHVSAFRERAVRGPEEVGRAGRPEQTRVVREKVLVVLVRYTRRSWIPGVSPRGRWRQPRTGQARGRGGRQRAWWQSRGWRKASVRELTNCRTSDRNRLPYMPDLECALFEGLQVGGQHDALQAGPDARRRKTVVEIWTRQIVVNGSSYVHRVRLSTQITLSLSGELDWRRTTYAPVVARPLCGWKVEGRACQVDFEGDRRDLRPDFSERSIYRQLCAHL